MVPGSVASGHVTTTLAPASTLSPGNEPVNATGNSMIACPVTVGSPIVVSGGVHGTEQLGQEDPPVLVRVREFERHGHLGRSPAIGDCDVDKPQLGQCINGMSFDNNPACDFGVLRQDEETVCNRFTEQRTPVDSSCCSIVARQNAEGSRRQGAIGVAHFEQAGIVVARVAASTWSVSTIALPSSVTQTARSLAKV